jgi:hypothetical protein
MGVEHGLSREGSGTVYAQPACSPDRQAPAASASPRLRPKNLGHAEKAQVFFDDVDTDIKPLKKQLSEQKLQHLSNIRVKALEKKKQMKEITEKANKLKEFESLKEAKKIQKEQRA